MMKKMKKEIEIEGRQMDNKGATRAQLDLYKRSSGWLSIFCQWIRKVKCFKLCIHTTKCEEKETV